MGALAWCIPLVMVGAVGCGRVGFDLLPVADHGKKPGSGSGSAGQSSGTGDSGVGEGSDAALDAQTAHGQHDADVADADAESGDGGVGDGGSDAGNGDVCVDDVCVSDVDLCTSDPDKTGPGICGCEVSDSADSDDDGTPDCTDECPDAPDVLTNGTCGCAAAKADDDDDGTANCKDACPKDEDKQSPGACGCGTGDDDGDSDGMPDCADLCATDPDKVAPGTCGCLVAESLTDTDDDGTPDCIDACSGVDDAQYAPIATCGVGYCRTHNTPSSCSAGVETACAPSAPLTATDATCDGIDDDCDGHADEEFAPYSSTCGVGACAAGGTVTCANGSTHDSCTAGSAGANDATCNGVDEDCSGQKDEDFVATPTTCGVGACTAAGLLMCMNGGTSDTCAPGTPAANDATCNGVDEDCSGQKDEDYVPVGSTCGNGVCARTGTVTCVSGMTQDSCTPATAGTSVDGPTANGLDDDCDGVVDEDACTTAAQTISATPCKPSRCRRIAAA
jgi:hypothetical protein